jgi:hypothetical protein
VGPLPAPAVDLAFTTLAMTFETVCADAPFTADSFTVGIPSQLITVTDNHWYPTDDIHSILGYQSGPLVAPVIACECA